MAESIEKRLTRAEINVELQSAFADYPPVAAMDIGCLINALSDAFFALQEETEIRVRREMLRPCLN